MINNSNDNLSQSLERYINSDALPMHMPGHKRNPNLIDVAFRKDITEINNFDDLKKPNGLIKDMEIKAARIWNASSSLISVNGSTGLLISTVLALCTLGKVLIASNCHISVWHGLELSKGNAVLIDPVKTSDGIWGAINPNDVDKLLTKDPSIKSVIITSPTYEGVVSDIPAIYEITRKHNVLLAIDEAHGAHLGLNNYFPNTSMADVVIKSIHKTLSAPTQTAIMLFYGDKASSRLITHYKNSIESSSPSYVLMAGICQALDEVDKDIHPLLAVENWVESLKECRKKLSSCKKITLFNSDDPSKLVLTSIYIGGYDMADILRDKYHIEVEAAFPNYIIAMTGIGDTLSSLTRFSDAIIEMDSAITEENSISNNIEPSSEVNSGLAISGESISRSLLAPFVSEPLDKIETLIGKISAEYLFAYPPGIPLLIPGMVITPAKAREIKSAMDSNLHLTSEPVNNDNQLFLVDTDNDSLV